MSGPLDAAQDRPDDAIREAQVRDEDDTEAAEQDPRVLEAVTAYLQALESGSRPSRREWARRYPEIADELAVYLDGLAFVHSAAGRLAGEDEGAAAERDRTIEADIAQGRPLGDFRLVREIGRGGMGVVYEAVQLSLNRRVAVKVLPLAGSLDSRQLERFKNEANAAAQLHHNNIVPVYAVGCERAVHFYAMQLIEGPSLAEVIRELRRIAGKNEPIDTASTIPVPAARAAATSALSSLLVNAVSEARPIPPTNMQALTTLHGQKGSAYFRSVARLAMQAAEALDYAHQLGVVHRDIKPANLLLDARGTLWMTDFGLARAFTDASITQSGDLIGTLRYMSPEQASGRTVVLDQRTDVYSLGITLFELVTLERAVDGRTREELLHRIVAVETPRARSVDAMVPRELETIIAKATEKDPGDRYISARAMADDLGRFLNDQPIRAKAPSLADKAVKWARRHRTLTLSAVAMLLLAAAGLLATTLLIAREQARTRAAYLLERNHAAEAERERARAEKSFGQARAGVDFFTRVAAEEMADNPQMTSVRKELLEASLDYYQEFIDDHKDDPAIGEALAVAQSRVSAILVELSAFEDFDRVQSRARLLFEPSVREDLKLTAEQSTKVAALQSNFPGAPSQPRKTFAALASEVEAAVSGLLTPQQFDRLKEISRQVRGVSAFDDPDVVRMLSLTRAQRDMVRHAQAEFRKAQRETNRRGGPWDPPPADGGTDPDTAQLRDAAVAKVTATFIPAQLQSWADLTGVPFKGELSRPQPPGFRRGGPPDRPHGMHHGEPDGGWDNGPHHGMHRGEYDGGQD